MQDPSLLDECELDETTKERLLENIKQKLTQQAVKIRADVEVACYTYEGEASDNLTFARYLPNLHLETAQPSALTTLFFTPGIDAVKDALRAGIACGTEEVPIKINLIAPPLYVVTTSTPEKSVRIGAKHSR